MHRVVWVILLTLAFGHAAASDWKYAGYLAARPNQPEAITFYDASSVDRDGPTVRYWVKAIPVRTLDNFSGPPGKKHDRFIETAAKLVASGYVPPLLRTSLREQLERERRDFLEFLASAVSWEVAANEGARFTSRFLFEIDCGRKAIRALDGDEFDKNGSPKPRAWRINREWNFIAPDTNGAWLFEVFCPPQQ